MTDNPWLPKTSVSFSFEGCARKSQIMSSVGITKNTNGCLRKELPILRCDPLILPLQCMIPQSGQNPFENLGWIYNESRTVVCDQQTIEVTQQEILHREADSLKAESRERKHEISSFCFQMGNLPCGLCHMTTDIAEEPIEKSINCLSFLWTYFTK